MTTPIDARGRYVEIAARRFAETGFHGVSLAALAKDAGVSKQALLHFFGTKERLYADVLSALSDRLTGEVEQAAAPDPAVHFVAYFDALAERAIARPNDARLVVRALLDSDRAARFWPLKPYLDTLVALARQTPRWRDASDAEVLASLSQLIGATQYVVVSSATLTGMYGEAAYRVMEARVVADIRAAARAFVATP